MSNITDPVGSVSSTYESTPSSQSNKNSGSGFSNVFNDMLNDQIKQSLMSNMPGIGNPGIGNPGSSGGINGFNNFGGISGIGGTNAMLGGMMPSATAGMENAIMASAGSGEMSGVQLMLFMMIMMMQTGEGGGDLAPILQMLAGMLSQSGSETTSKAAGQTPIMWPENTDPSIKSMVDIAMSQVGYQEKNKDGTVGNGNITKFGAWYGMDGQPWCAMFVSWAADQAGLLHDTVPRHASTARGVEAYREKGLYAPQGSGYLPQEGDAIYFRNPSGRISHVGIVVAFDPASQRVYTVEGNTNNAVRVRHYDLTDQRIHGYGRNGGKSNGVIPKNSSSGSGANTV